jgi:hypothetical protein
MSMRFARLIALLGALLLASTQAPGAGAAHVRGRATSGFTVTLDGRVVQHKLVGYQPDFDPIDRVVIAATLRHVRSAGTALPDCMLVLSLYLENFTAATTPLLPDLLHPDQVATGLGGFMQGKSVLVTAAGTDGYRGSVLAEVFLDNTVHLALDLLPAGSSPSASPVRLLGTLTLASDLSVHGEVHGQQPLAPRILRVPRGPAVTWQAVVYGLAVHVPPMMGTVLSRLPQRPAPGAAPATTSQPGLPRQTIAQRRVAGQPQQSVLGPRAWALLALIALLGGLFLLLRRHRPGVAGAPR